MDKDTYLEIYRILDEVSPVPFDCGRICGSACCISESDDDGIFLLPGEEMLHDREDWESWEIVDTEHFAVPESWNKKAVFVTCKKNGVCDRKRRPIQCRTFPLVPGFTGGELSLEKNGMLLGYACPLLEQETPLNPDFERETKRAWGILVKDDRIRDWVAFLTERCGRICAG